MRQIHKATTRYSLQEIASSIQSDLDRRNLSYEEALNLGNILQDRADTLPGDEIVYAVSDRDSYRRTLELYLKDGVLTQAEQLVGNYCAIGPLVSKSLANGTQTLLRL